MIEQTPSEPLLPPDTRRRRHIRIYDVTYHHANGGSVTLEERKRSRTISSVAPLPESCYTINTFLFFLSCFQLLNILTMTYTSSVLNFIAKRFVIPNTMASFIPSSYQIGNLVVVIPISYYGNKFNRPKAIGVGLMVMIIGLGFCILPHLILPPSSSHDVPPSELCYTNSSNATYHEVMQKRSTMLVMPNNLPCNENSTTQNPAVLLIIGHILVGAGSAPLWPLGIAYIDDHVVVRKVSIYIGILLGTTMIGPVFGFMLGSISSAIDVNLSGMKQSDPGYIGAWWLGYVIILVLLVVLLFPFYFYPRSLPLSHQKQIEIAERLEVEEQKRISQQASEAEAATDDSSAQSEETNGCTACQAAQNNKESGWMLIFTKLKDLLCDTRKMFSKSMVVTPIVSFTALAILIAGVTTFGPSYLQMEFNLLRSTADMLIGGICVPSGIFGVLLGAYIQKHKNFNIRQALLFIIAGSFVGVLLLAAVFACRCPMQPLAGLTTPYSVDSSRTGLNSQCNRDCICPPGEFDLVCGSDNITYVSPCYAGCKADIRDKDSIFAANIMYKNCSCITDGNAINGPCSASQCVGALVAFVILVAFAVFFLCLCQAPLYVLLLRSLEPQEKSFGIGLMSFFSLTLGSIPGPIWYGLILDKNCIYWSAKCLGKSICLLYSTDGLRIAFVGISFAVAVAYSLAFVICFIWREFHKERYETATEPCTSNCGDETQMQNAEILNGD